MEDRVILSLNQINKSFGNVEALKGVNFELKCGEVHALLGSNGAGKSTLMKIISGAYQQDSGDIYVDGTSVPISEPQDSKDEGISIVYQEFSLIKDLTVAENIFLDRLPLKRKFPPIIDYKKMINDAKANLNEMDVDIDVRKPVSQLPVGEQQIVEIAKSLTSNTKVLILDEPTSALNSKEIEQLFKLVNVLKQRGVGIIYITHRLNELEEICDQVTVMRDGGKVATYNVGDKTINEMVEQMLGRSHQSTKKKRERKFNSDKPLLYVENLVTPNLKGVSLTLSPGEIVGMSGQMGSGRTETLKAIFGLDNIKKGHVSIEGKKIKNINTKKMIKKGIGFVSEDRKGEGIFPERSIKENITVSVMPQISKLYTILKKQEKDLCMNMIDKTGLHPPLPDNPIGSLSGGNQQKAVLGRWLALSNLKILLLDEPTRGIDVGAKAKVYSLLDEIASKGVGVLITSSDTDELVEVSDRVYVLERKKIKNELTGENITFDNLSLEVLGGISDGTKGV